MIEAILAMMAISAVVQIVDRAVGRRAPHRLARLAVLSLGVEREVLLPRRAASAPAGSYRTDAGTAAAEGVDARWRALEALPYGALDRHAPDRRTKHVTKASVLVVEGRVEGRVLALRARMTMPASLGMIAVTINMAAFTMYFLGGVVGVCFLALLLVTHVINGLVWRRSARKELAEAARAVVDEVAARYADAEAAPPAAPETAAA